MRDSSKISCAKLSRPGRSACKKAHLRDPAPRLVARRWCPCLGCCTQTTTARSPVSGRTAVAPVKNKTAFSAQNCPTTEITCRRSSSSIPRTVQLRALFNCRNPNVQRIDRTLNRLISRHNCESAAEAPVYSPGSSPQWYCAQLYGILLRHPILRPTQLHIAAPAALKPPKERPFSVKRQIHVIFTANPNKNGDTSTFPREKICPMEYTGNCATFLRSCSYQRLPLFVQITALGGDVERVLQLRMGKLLGFLNFTQCDSWTPWKLLVANHCNNFKFSFLVSIF